MQMIRSGQFGSMLFLLLCGLPVLLLPTMSGPSRDIPGLVLFTIAWALGLVGLALNSALCQEVDRLSPARTLFEAIDNRRIWREHEQLFPESRLRKTTKTILILCVCCLLGGFVLLLVKW